MGRRLSRFRLPLQLLNKSMYNDKELTWREEDRKKVFESRVFSVYESHCRSPHNELRPFSVIDAPDWAIVAPVLDTPEGKKFVMVWQWRHGARCPSLEFPGGVFEEGENPEDAAARELLEETGFKAGAIRKMADFSPNPAIMSNQVHLFLAENLVDTCKQSLDADEFVAVELVSIDDVFKGMGKPPYIHALMGTVLAMYLQQHKTVKDC